MGTIIDNPYPQKIAELARKQSSMKSDDFIEQMNALAEKSEAFMREKLVELEAQAIKHTQEVQQLKGKKKPKGLNARKVYVNVCVTYREAVKLVDEMRKTKKALREILYRGRTNAKD